MSTSASDESKGALVVIAPAKVNLYLGVHTQRDDRGYHRVDSVIIQKVEPAPQPEEAAEADEDEEETSKGGQ